MRTPKSVNKTPARQPIGKTLGRDDAQEIAIRALGFLASDRRRLERFVALSGLAPQTLRAAAAAPGFLLAVLDHVVGEETLLVGFSAAEGRDPRDIVKARAILGEPQGTRGAGIG